ncbi:MAG: DEAD/DEAH box helicase [Thermoplasmataceae archaeon]
MVSVTEAIKSISRRHIEFLEATYHISNERLIRERRQLMQEGTVYTEPWIEGSPRYKLGKSFTDLNISESVKSILLELQEKGLVYPPYEHQFKSLESFFSEGKNLVISTGTGSGKTEIFLFSLIGMMAKEAERGVTNKMRAVRTIVLYPMNALVADQLARIRKLFGGKSGAKSMQNMFGRNIQFAMYTSRTPYHGVYDTKKNNYKIKPVIDYFVKLKNENPRLFDELNERGRIPAKDLIGFSMKNDKNEKYTTQPGDSELYTRQEMLFPNENGGVPDLLITNYSMLEYMLLRPIEQPFFESTRNWLNADEENQLLLVIDEAHLYRGAQGAEVAMLIRRLLNHLDINQDRVRFILSSASLGDPVSLKEKGAEFGSSLTGNSKHTFEVITGERFSLKSGSELSNNLGMESLTSKKNSADEVVLDILEILNWKFEDRPESKEFGKKLGERLMDERLFRVLYSKITGKPESLSNLSRSLFPSVDPKESESATLNLLLLSSKATLKEGEKLLPSRIHIIFKGLPKIYICINPNCSAKRANDEHSKLLGKMYIEPRIQCECGARVFELLTDRDCGAAYIKGYRKSADAMLDMVFLWDEIQTGKFNLNNGDAALYDELHLLMEEPRKDPGSGTKGSASLFDKTQKRFLNIYTGHLTEDPSKEEDGDFIPVWVPQEITEEGTNNSSSIWSWKMCPACGKKKKGSNNVAPIMDLETKGEAPFANITKELFMIQPADPNKTNMPNQGKKVLCFSDGRQKAARLARDLQRSVERDSFREMVVDIIRTAPDKSLNSLYPNFLLLSKKYNVGFFDDEDSVDKCEGSRTLFENAKNSLDEIASRYGETVDDLFENSDFYDQMNSDRPGQYNRALLRLLGNKYYSIRALLIAYLEPSESVFSAIQEHNKSIDADILRGLLLHIIQNSLYEAAFDKDHINDIDRQLSRQSITRPTGWSRGKEEEGLKIDELIPREILKLENVELTEDQIKTLRTSLIRTSEVNGMRIPRLFDVNGKQKYFLNPDAVIFHQALFEEWLRCESCHEFTPYGIGGKCEQCGGRVKRVTTDDTYLTARKELFRDPCREIFNGIRKPFTLRSEEHSAQVSSKDFSDIFSPSEKYELLFQDIMISENISEQPVDILSSTTTMEVGIDIGSLTGVGMRTIPPLPSNYQQRAGRAGRRGASLSTIITYADNSPYETYSFNHPELLIGAQNVEPIIYINNKKIIERHVNATLIQKFFQKAPIPQTADVFSSLGSAAAFFTDKGNFSLKAFKEWIDNEVVTNESALAKNISKIIPGELELNTDGDANWKEVFVKETANNFICSLDKLAESNDWAPINDEEHNLLSALLDAALLPTFSFPIDVCTFAVFDDNYKQNRLKTKYNIGQDLKQALSEYVPSRQIVVDKKTYTSYGLYFPFTKDQTNRARKIEWESLEWSNYCARCGTILSEKGVDLSQSEAKCMISTCGAPIKSIRIYKPEGFSPEVKNKKVVEGERKEDGRIYAQPAKFPLSSKENDGVTPTDSFGTNHGVVYHGRNKELEIVNFGPNQEGFVVCRECGAIGDKEFVSKSHNRPYPVFYKGSIVPNKCAGSIPAVTSFGFSFHSDITVFRTKFTGDMRLEYNELWFDAACQSLSEALVIGATRTLIIDPRELSGNYRVLGPTEEDARKGVTGYVEFFLYDTTSGGAGFSGSVYNRFEEVLKTTRALLQECECEQSCPSCLRTYSNRIWHEKLDRNLALDLLNYIQTGEMPFPNRARAKIFIDRLEKTLKLMNSNLRTERSNEPTDLTVRANGKHVKVFLKSCMTANPFPTSITAYASDFDLLHSLPTVAGTIIGHLG